MGFVRHVAALAFVFATGSVASSARGLETLQLEYKVLLQEARIPEALQSLRFSRVVAERSQLYYFDTKDLKLFGAGLVVRARDVVGQTGEVSVKARPLEYSDLDESWFEVPGFSCDVDATPIKTSPACSIRLPKPSGDILSVVNGLVDIGELLEPDQRYFANDFGGFDAVAQRVRLLGPITAYRWKVPNHAGWRVMAEYWQLPNGPEFLEISITGMQTDHQRLASAMKTFVKERALDTAPSTINKTSTALKILSK